MSRVVLNYDTFTTEAVQSLWERRDIHWPKLLQQIPDLDELMEEMAEGPLLGVLLSPVEEELDVEEIIHDVQLSLLVGVHMFGIDYMTAQLAVRPEVMTAGLVHATGEIENCLQSDNPTMAFLVSFLVGYGMSYHASVDCDEDYDREKMTQQTYVLLSEMQLPEQMDKDMRRMIVKSYFNIEEETGTRPVIPKNKLN